jgi:ribosomal peptide maturation radical SAM protein 1
MARSDVSTCLVSTPFIPITMPGLGVATLKASLAREGLRAEVYYAALDYFRFYHDADASPDEPLLEYNYVAQNSAIGDVFFAGALWRDMPDTFGMVERILRAMGEAPSAWMEPGLVRRVMSHVEDYARRAADFISFCYEARDWGSYDIVGFSSTFSQNVAALCLARLIREHHPGIHIVFGGANCEGDMGVQMLRSFPFIDTIVRGEADLAFPRFVRNVGRRVSVEDVPGIVFRSGGEVREGAPPEPIRDLDDLPVPDFSDYFAQLPPIFTRSQVPLALPIETSRGCWWGAVSHCTFCGLNPTTMKFRAKTPSRAITEIDQLSQAYGIRQISAVDNIISHRYFSEVLPALEGKGYSIFYETKSNLDEGQVSQLARAGVNNIQPGIESLSTEILKLMKKGVSGIQNVALLKWCAIYGVNPTWFLLYRFPEEPQEPYWRDIALLPRLVHLPPPKNPNPVVIDRYSPLFTFRDHNGLDNVRPIGRAKVFYRGLDEEARFNISYHFDADVSQPGTRPPYEKALLAGVLAWNYAYVRGARFYQFQAPQTTLLLDTRRENDTRVYLLTGVGHHLHAALRTARRRASLSALLSRPPAADYSLEDLLLAHVGGALGAQAIASPEDEGDLSRFLEDLESRLITCHLDDRWLALAVDCVHVEHAAPYGLAQFARSVGELSEEAARRAADRRSPSASLVQVRDASA